MDLSNMTDLFYILVDSAGILAIAGMLVITELDR